MESAHTYISIYIYTKFCHELQTKGGVFVNFSYKLRERFQCWYTQAFGVARSLLSASIICLLPSMGYLLLSCYSLSIIHSLLVQLYTSLVH